MVSSQREALAKFIKQQRLKNGWTQEYLASELGVSRPTYSQIEQGKREITIAEAEILAKIFGMPLADFLAVKEPKQPLVIKSRKKRKKTNSIQIRVAKRDLDKFRQVLLYILNKVGGKPNVGETVIHKLLYFIDFDYYEKFEETLMGATYIKNYHGPTANELKQILKEMEKEGEIEAVKSKYFKYQQKKYLARKRPNLANLSAQEIEHIDSVLARLSNKNAKELEKYSHSDIPWMVAKEGEQLSYESVFYRDEQHSVRNYSDAL